MFSRFSSCKEKIKDNNSSEPISNNQSMSIGICNALYPSCEFSDTLSVEMDEMWSYYHDKTWLWWAVDHDTGIPLAFTFGSRNDDTLYELIALLEGYGIE